VSRPIGGWLSDKVGGARVTFWTFVVMGPESRGCALFLAFMVLFLTTGIDNGSTYRMIHSVFRTERVREAVHRGEGARTEAAPRPEGGFLWDRLRGRYRSFGGFLVPISLQVLDLHVR
jgi:NNP family nitrate/nitrite transporter-like MFS transporter